MIESGSTADAQRSENGGHSGPTADGRERDTATRRRDSIGEMKPREQKNQPRLEVPVELEPFIEAWANAVYAAMTKASDERDVAENAVKHNKK